MSQCHSVSHPETILIEGDEMKKKELSEEPLTITFKQLHDCLKAWGDHYISTEVRFGSKRTPYLTQAGLLDDGNRRQPDDEIMRRMPLTNLAGLFWETLKAGANETERIHDEHFVCL